MQEDMPQFELTGSAVRGINSANMMASSLPVKVRLGYNKPRAHSNCLKMSNYVNAQVMANLPASTNWREKAAPSLERVYMNNTYGCCVFSSVFHRLGLWSANDSDAPGIILATDKEVEQQYLSYTGGRDNGANISEVLDIFRSKGFTAGGKKYLIDGYVSVDWTNWDLVRAAIAIFGAVNVGFDLPGAWMNSDTWDVANAGSRIVGGHDVTMVDFDGDNLFASSWGRIYRWTKAAFTSRKWNSECFASLAPSWYNGDLIAPSGFKVDALKADLAKIHGGEIPDFNPPAPPLPVPPGQMRLLEDARAGVPARAVFGSDQLAGPYWINERSD